MTNLTFEQLQQIFSATIEEVKEKDEKHLNMLEIMFKDTVHVQLLNLLSIEYNEETANEIYDEMIVKYNSNNLVYIYNNIIMPHVENMKKLLDDLEEPT